MDIQYAYLANQKTQNKQWNLLLVYNLYRVLCVFLFIGIYYYSLNILPSNWFISVLIVYCLCILVFVYWGQRRVLSFEKQVIISGVIDVIAFSSILSLVGNLQSGQGILLNATIAALSILVPGRIAIFFAALASFLLLAGSVVQFVYDPKDLSHFYYSGIYGAGFFATALTAWYLSNWVRQSEALAQRRSEELVGMQRINEYIIERLHSGVIYVDEYKRILLINSAVREFFGLNKTYQPPHLKNISSLLDEQLDGFLIKTWKKEHSAQATINDPFLRVQFFSIVVANKPVVLIILEDMTYIAQQAQQLKLASLGRFSASIAHELRNPLGAIAHAIQLLGDEGGLNSEDTRLKELIINNCLRMNGVIKNVLQLSRREKAKPELNEINLFLEQFKQNFCHNTPCDLILKLPKRKLFIVFDKSQLEQVLVNLCENATKHGLNQDGMSHIVITAKATAKKLSIIVSDSGPGVPEEFQDAVFDPFFTTLRNGTGMGLFIARDLCEINQARLNLVKVSKGCAFSITQNLSDEFLL